jgi:oligopeptidase B
VLPPPVARKVPRVDVVHGDVRQDDYAWLREKDSPEVTAYLEAENAYADAILKPTEEFQAALYREMLARIKEDDQSVPYPYGGWLYYSRTETGKQYPIHCRRRALDDHEVVTLDLNALAAGHEFLSLGAYTVSDDGRWLAYTLDFTGFREYTLYVKDLFTGEVTSERIEKVSSVAWTADSATIFYVLEDDAKRPYRLWRHRLGAPPADDAFVYEETASASGARAAAACSSPAPAASPRPRSAGCRPATPPGTGAWCSPARRSTSTRSTTGLARGGTRSTSAPTPAVAATSVWW